MQFYAQKFTHVAWCNFAKGKGQNLRPPSLRLLTNSPRFFFSKQSRFVVSRWWYLIDIKLLNTAFVISKMNGQEYFDDRSRVCFTNFIPVRIIFNRIIFFFFSLSFLQRTNHRRHIFLANKSETMMTTTHASIFSWRNPKKAEKRNLSYLNLTIKRFGEDKCDYVNEHDNFLNASRTCEGESESTKEFYSVLFRFLFGMVTRREGRVRPRWMVCTCAFAFQCSIYTLLYIMCTIELYI